jgi:predicted nucleic acid-binding protein
LFAWHEHPDDEHLINLAINARADFMVTWENRILRLLADDTVASRNLRSLTPHLKILTPQEFSQFVPRPSSS